MRDVLVNGLVKLALEKSVVIVTDCPDMTIVVDWDIKNQTKQTNKTDQIHYKSKQKVH